MFVFSPTVFGVQSFQEEENANEVRGLADGLPQFLRRNSLSITFHYFSEAKNDQGDDERAGNESDQTVSANKRVDFCGESKNAGADNAVNSDRNEIPSSDASDQGTLRSFLHARRLINKNLRRRKGNISRVVSPIATSCMLFIEA